MVGEMRDPETAAIAVQAAMTGHLVLSTLHTNDAASAVTRLVDLKVEPYLIAGTVEGVLAQRLVRKICPECRERYKPGPAAPSRCSPAPGGARDARARTRLCVRVARPATAAAPGSSSCSCMTDEIRQALLKLRTQARLRELRSGPTGNGRRSGTDGWRKVQAGITTVEEVLRVAEH